MLGAGETDVGVTVPDLRSSHLVPEVKKIVAFGLRKNAFQKPKRA